MKKICMSIVGILTVFLIIGCSNENKDNEKPIISLNLKVYNLSDDEFKTVGVTKELENVTKDDFKNIELTLDVEHSDNIDNRKITVPSIKEIANLKYKDRYWFGEGSNQDNKNENFAKYNEKVVFYAKGLEEKDIKEMFKSSDVKISWTTTNGKDKEESFNLGDI